jgi:hypothetical protein
MQADIRVNDILAVRPLVRETIVRTVGPCLVFIVELEAPVRVLSHTYSDQEARALLTWARSNPDTAGILAAYSDTLTTSDGYEDLQAVERERRHEERIQLATPAVR